MAVFSKKKLAETRGGGPFVSEILLKDGKYDLNKLVETINSDWEIKLPNGSVNETTNTLSCSIDGVSATVTLINAPIANDKAVKNAETNFRWEGAVEVAKAHKAHLQIVITTQNEALTKASTTLVKISSSALKQDIATGIQTVGTVFAPDFYVDFAEDFIKDDAFPIWNLVFFGLYSNDQGKTFSGYTNGMKVFNKDEIEIIDSEFSADEVVELLTDIANYSIEEDVTLLDGETIGFTEDQKLPITKSQGIALPFETMKIKF